MASKKNYEVVTFEDILLEINTTELETCYLVIVIVI